MSAESVGWSSNLIRLGKLSGRNAFKTRLVELGVTFENDTLLNNAFERFKSLADKKRDIYDDDLLAVAAGTERDEDNRYRLLSFSSTTGSDRQARATVVFSVDGEAHTAEANGDGQVDAAFCAVESKIQSGASLALYAVRNITAGSDAQGDVSVRLQKNGAAVTGHGADTDIVIASVKAYLNALGRLEGNASRTHPQQQTI
jgi:2-isopropylmalate synthase